MKTLTVILFCLTAFLGKAQLTFGVKAGYNTTTPHILKSSSQDGEKTTSGNGWQAALYIEQHLHKWFIYSGAGIMGNNFGTNFYFWGGSSNTYHPLYLTIPLGAGYQFTLHKNFIAKIYGGGYLQSGIGGRVKTVITPYCDFVACPETPPSITEYRDIKFKSGTSDFERVNAGLQFGAGLQAFKKVELEFMYYAGLTSIMPKDFNYTMRLNSFVIDAKFNMLQRSVKK